MLVRKGRESLSSLPSMFENVKSPNCLVLILGGREDGTFLHRRLDRS